MRSPYTTITLSVLALIALGSDAAASAPAGADLQSRRY
jgi:hypothetical protein